MCRPSCRRVRFRSRSRERGFLDAEQETVGLFAALGGKTVGALDKHAVGSQAVCWRRVLEAPRTGPLHSRFVLCASRPLEHGPGDHREVLEEREEGEREVVVQPRRKFLRGRGGLTPHHLASTTSAPLLVFCFTEGSQSAQTPRGPQT